MSIVENRPRQISAISCFRVLLSAARLIARACWWLRGYLKRLVAQDREVTARLLVHFARSMRAGCIATRRTTRCSSTPFARCTCPSPRPACALGCRGSAGSSRSRSRCWLAGAASDCAQTAGSGAHARQSVAARSRALQVQTAGSGVVGQGVPASSSSARRPRPPTRSINAVRN
jgi:hypothetical protein